jgi:hypothetical protein
MLWKHRAQAIRYLLCKIGGPRVSDDCANQAGNWKEWDDFDWNRWNEYQEWLDGDDWRRGSWYGAEPEEPPQDAENWAIVWYTKRGGYDNERGAMLDEVNEEVISEALSLWEVGGEKVDSEDVMSFTATGVDGRSYSYTTDVWAIRTHRTNKEGDKELTKAMLEWCQIDDGLESYSILDENALSEREHTRAQEIFTEEVNTHLNEYAPENAVDIIYEWLRENNEDAINHLYNELYISGAAIRPALAEHGWSDMEEDLENVIPDDFRNAGGDNIDNIIRWALPIIAGPNFGRCLRMLVENLYNSGKLETVGVEEVTKILREQPDCAAPPQHFPLTKQVLYQGTDTNPLGVRQVLKEPHVREEELKQMREEVFRRQKEEAKYKDPQEDLRQIQLPGMEEEPQKEWR